VIIFISGRSIYAEENELGAKTLAPGEDDISDEDEKKKKYFAENASNNMTEQESVLVLLKYLMSKFISLETLEKTMIGKTVNKLAKSTQMSPEVKTLAVELVEIWKETAKNHRKQKKEEERDRKEKRKLQRLEDSKKKMRKIFKTYRDETIAPPCASLISQNAVKKKKTVLEMFQKR